jgi:hypothetical protein
MPMNLSRHVIASLRSLVIVAAIGATASPGLAQTQATQPQPAPSDEEPVNVGDTNVGYIDSAIPATQFRLRSDIAYGNDRPTRAEFFYARGAPLGPGLPVPETSVDYQDISSYLELALDDCTSIFGELPVRFINPDINDNSAGLGDSNVGIKRALIFNSEEVVSFQLKVYIPSGDADRGLGNHHTTIEPGLLCYKKLNCSWALEGELRYWVPVDGTEGFEGEVIRYGAGVSCKSFQNCHVSVSPVAEFVGWTVLSGKVAVTESPGAVQIEDATGDTIVNVKVGLRFGFGPCRQAYFGYGRALTGDQWYDDVFRLEYRRFF